MAVSTTEVVLLSLITIDVNFTVNVKNWTRWGCFPGLASPFHFVKIQSTHTSLEPQEQSYNSCIKSKTPTLINGMQGSHTALLIHIIIVIDCSVAIWKVTMLQFTTTAVTLVVLTWSVYMKWRLVLVHIKTILSKGSIQWGPTINVDCNGQTIKSVKEHYCDI